MGKIPDELKATIARNIRDCRMKKYPGRGGGKKCAESFGVSPQQWSPWERGMRTPDELRLMQIAEFFDVTVEYLRRDNSVKPLEHGSEMGQYAPHPGAPYYDYASEPQGAPPPTLREPDAPPYGLPSLRREDNSVSIHSIAELSHVSSRLLGMLCTTTKGVVDGRFDVGKSIIVLRRLGDILEQKLHEAETMSGNHPAPHSRTY